MLCISKMSDFKLDHPNFEWEGRQTCVMNSEELLDILGKVSEKRNYHRSRAHTLYRCTVDIRQIQYLPWDMKGIPLSMFAFYITLNMLWHFIVIRKVSG